MFFLKFTQNATTMSGAWSSGRTISGEVIDHLKLIDSAKSPYKASWWSQMRAVLWRSWISILKEPLLIKVRILQTLVRIYFCQSTCSDMFTDRIRRNRANRTNATIYKLQDFLYYLVTTRIFLSSEVNVNLL